VAAADPLGELPHGEVLALGQLYLGLEEAVGALFRWGQVAQPVPGQRRIEVQLPDGLLELNRP